MKKIYYSLFLGLIAFNSTSTFAQQPSVAHAWTEINLEAVRRDIARPTVHARNLFHLSIAMYDAWAAYDTLAEPFFLGKNLGNYNCVFNGVPSPGNLANARKQAVSYAAYRILRNRYQGSPGQSNTFMTLDTMMIGLGYATSFTNTDYANGGPAALGNYIAQQLIAAGYQDGSNQQNSYANQYYQPVNEDIFMVLDSVGNPNITDMNRWQPISVPLFYDQACQPFPYTPPFLGPEWGHVIGFALDDSIKTVHTRDGNNWNAYHDPGPPPLHSMEGDGETIDYQTGFEITAIWSSHMDATDGVMWDISPASRGGFDHNNWPNGHNDYLGFYDMFNGGTPNPGHAVNPSTGQPYAPQIVPRGDYARILAEFWADGPKSETPPGHWFSIYNDVSLYPAFNWKWEGQGVPLDHLEYDVKAYLTLGGALHDCAVATWGVKGYYDYIRPVSAIRAMADLGQSSDSNLANYHPGGLHLYPGYIELINAGDPIEGSNGQHIGKIKIKSWLGPIIDDDSDPCIDGANYVPVTLGVGWKLAENWWPYQRPTFVSPNFAGYVSGHSTFSRAAAEVMTDITGDEYFPGGLGVFQTPQNDFLVFEEGPSVAMELEWATYRDAADQCSLSRIWGGIHPPQDDIRGRKMGLQIGLDALVHANTLFSGGRPIVEALVLSDELINSADDGNTTVLTISFDKAMDSSVLPNLSLSPVDPTLTCLTLTNTTWSDNKTLVLTYMISDAEDDLGNIDIFVSGAKSTVGGLQYDYYQVGSLFIDTENPTLANIVLTPSATQVTVDLEFSESMDMTQDVLIAFPVEDPLAEVLTLNSTNWISSTQYQLLYDISDDTEIYDVDVDYMSAVDSAGNVMLMASYPDLFTIDRHDPLLNSITLSDDLLNRADIGFDALAMTLVYDEEMNPASFPMISFPTENATAAGLVLNSAASLWMTTDTYIAVYDLSDLSAEMDNIDVAVAAAQDRSGNTHALSSEIDLFFIDTKAPLITANVLSSNVLNDASAVAGMLTLELTFDEAMDTALDPTISYPVENASSALSVSSVVWTDMMNVNFTMDVTDIDTDIANVDLLFSNYTDEAGNPAMDLLLADALDILMQNPSLSSLESDEAYISDADAGNTLSITLTFDEAMDEAATPTVGFVSGSADASLDQVDVAWNSPTELLITYLVNDAEVLLENISIEVIGALDTDGNQIQMNTMDSGIFIDTENPTSSDVSLSSTLLMNGDIGIENFIIDVTFSEDMSTLIPSLDFPVEDPSSTLMSNGAASSWTSSNSYRFVFDVMEGMSSLNDIDLSITAASDTIGNLMSLYDLMDAFDIEIVSGLVEQEGIAMQVYPNPIQEGQVFIQLLRGALDQANVQLYDGQGKMVINERKNLQLGGRISLDTSSLESGIYQLLIEDGSHSFRSKLVVLN